MSRFKECNIRPWNSKWSPLMESPTDKARKEFPRGDGNWPGWEKIYDSLMLAATKMGASKSHLSDIHIKTMAIAGCGHEETMKGWALVLRSYGWI